MLKHLLRFGRRTNHLPRLEIVSRYIKRIQANVEEISLKLINLSIESG